MKFTFLHISDLHYQPDWHEEIELVCRKFIEDVTSQAKNYENLYLVFSGDLVSAGADNEFFQTFDTNLVKALDLIGFPKERRICVPGNHDISRDALRPLLTIQKGTLTEMTDERLFNNNLPQNSKIIFAPKFENYKTYESQFANYTACASSLGGAGWDLPNGIGIYCLNTAICSFASIEDNNGKPISDQNQLMIDTRSLHQWLTKTDSTTRILVMHHPLEWLAGWAKSELEKIIANSFQLIFSGHIHENSATFSSRGAGTSVHCSAPQLFTKKTDLLGYSFVSIDTSDKTVEVSYRQWSSPTQKFVMGTSLAGNDSGKIIFSHRSSNYVPIEVIPPVSQSRDTLAILQAEFDEATTCYSSKKLLWVDRDLANLSEKNAEGGNVVLISQNEFIKNFRGCIIRAPKQFGLTCLGRFIALSYYRQKANGTAVAVLNTMAMPHHREGIVKHIEARCKELNIEQKSLAGIILDNWHSDKGTRRILRELKTEYSNVPVILLQSMDDCAQIADAIESEEEQAFEPLFLWALTRERIRELVVKYVHGMDALDDNLVTKKVINDIDALNMHRTPLNCLLLLKLAEQQFDDSPVNRTEMIGRVLYLLFYQFDKIPRYATRPDIKDCEYALGFFCEWLMCSSKTAFSKDEFYRKVKEYCSLQILDLDVDVLFGFLVTENIFVRKGLEFEFRFNYWLYFFAAHRMHHDSKFAEFILSERRYSAFPEIIEFYAGIDRRRSDAVIRLTEDLKLMNADFSKRTGIPAEFNPFRNAQWSPTTDAIAQLKQEVENSMAESTLPAVVKDRIADQNYNRARPYNQELAKFINESSLKQLVQAMKGAARALRNSDHVLPDEKTKLLEEVMNCWVRVCQILTLISPVLANQKRAGFEGMGFYLDKTFDGIDTVEKRWKTILSVITGNIVTWYQEDIFSKKMGELLIKYVRDHEDKLGELLVLLMMVMQKPLGWEKEVERFIVRENKNSFYLNQIYFATRHEFKTSFSTERTRQDLRRLAAMAVAKHETGAKHPNLQLIEKAAKAVLDKDDVK
jgi:predicted MPP superfamily phosphohydrolase